MQNLKPKKHLGQHFLADENIARKIVDLVENEGDTPVVEIGPGMGVLTKYLVDRHAVLHAVDYDADAIAYLREAFADTRLQLHHADFLKWPLAEVLDGPAQWVGNLPYNVSSPIFFRLLEHRDRVQRGVFMVQKEVADRVCADPAISSKSKGILTILMDCYFELKMEFKVSPKVFKPPPKVMSAVFSMNRKPNVDVDFEDMRTVVKAAYGKRRKTLRNSLKELEFDLEQVPAEWWELRAEALDTAQFVRIAQALRKA